jgi:hypothetical protein
VRKGFALADVMLLLLAMDLRARAQDILAKTETTYDVDAQYTMCEVAARYEKFAERVEQRGRRAKQVWPTRSPSPGSWRRTAEAGPLNPISK